MPLGGGLSSSASVEVAVATIVEAMFFSTLASSRARARLEAEAAAAEGATPATSRLHDLSPLGRALRCQRAEHQFAKMPCTW